MRHLLTIIAIVLLMPAMALADTCLLKTGEALNLAMKRFNNASPRYFNNDVSIKSIEFVVGSDKMTTDIISDSKSDVPGYVDFDSETGKITIYTEAESFTGSSNMQYFFYELNALTTIVGFEHVITTSVTNMTYMFYNCSKLTSLYLGKDFTIGNSTGINSMCQGMVSSRNSKCTIYCTTAVKNKLSSTTTKLTTSRITWVLLDENVTLTDGEQYNLTTSRTTPLLTYHRTFSNTEWQPLYVPFAMEYADWQDFASIYSIQGFKEGSTKDDFTMLIEEVTDATLPNTFYLIRANEAEAHDFQITDATLKAKTEAEQTFTEGDVLFTLYGTYSGVTGSKLYDGGSQRYWCMAGGNLYYPTSTSQALKPYRWYLSTTDVEGRTANVRFLSWDDDFLTNAAPSPLLPLTNRTETEQKLREKKLLKDGRIIILKNGIEYNIDGTKCTSGHSF